MAAIDRSSALMVGEVPLVDSPAACVEEDDDRRLPPQLSAAASACVPWRRVSLHRKSAWSAENVAHTAHERKLVLERVVEKGSESMRLVGLASKSSLALLLVLVALP
jgi:hypothetical protein